MPELGTDARPLRVAIVGSGPSGFYAAEALLLKSDASVLVDMFDRLPTPYGLVRGGVAPDHPKIKSVIRVYDRIAASDGFSFLGNVFVGRDIHVAELIQHYDALIFACGAETDNPLNLPGEDLPGSHTATEFVGWYNGHPDYTDCTFDLSCDSAVIIGQGNVAVDVARILATPVDALRTTDIAQHALDVLAGSNVKDIYLIGRRGPVQAKFTPPELKELGQLDDCRPVVIPGELEIDPVSQAELDDPAGSKSGKNLNLLREFASRPAGTTSKRCHIRFFNSPVELKGTDRLDTVVLERNRLEGEPFHQRAVGTGLTEELPCGILFRSVGYRGLPIPGVPFDPRTGTFPNREGRIEHSGEAVPGLYAVGWIKRGPSGIIGNNKPDSQETVRALLADSGQLPPCPTPDSAAVRQLLASRGVRVVGYDEWRIIDAAEVERGRPKGKPREKFVRVTDMLAALP
ncbi:MAG: FAD-dependent oxidoreductase [Candidatus Hydrogenedentes bacterium]|nr:FAD-dependent oxidoreductase [Candidatus Hydrogenedentota bacterium]